jgi:hypothetical protein
MESLMQTYFCDSYRTVKFESLDPSVGFGFYISDVEDLADFIKGIENLKSKYHKNYFLYTDVSCPQYLKEETSFYESVTVENRKS